MGIRKEEWCEVETKEGDFFKGLFIFIGMLISILIWAIVIKFLIEVAM